MAKKKRSHHSPIRHNRNSIRRSFRNKINNNISKFKPENALNTIVRLEGIERPNRPRIYENKNLTLDKTPLKLYNPFVLNLKTEKEVCRERKERRKQIMRNTRGRGLRIKKATWTDSSYIVCS